MRVDWLPVPPPGLPHRTRLRLRSHLSQPLRSAHALLLSLGWIVLSFAFWLVWASLLACLLPLTATHLLCVSVVDPVADPSTARPWRLLTPPRLYHLLAHIGSAIGVATVYARAVLSFPMYNNYTLVSLCVSLFSLICLWFLGLHSPSSNGQVCVLLVLPLQLWFILCVSFALENTS